MFDGAFRCSLRRSDPRPIVNRQGHIVAVMAGQPHDLTYSAACMNAYDQIVAEGEGANFRQASKHHRGTFPAVNVGISYGKGQKVPACLQNGILAAIVNQLVSSEAVIQMATYANGKALCFLPRSLTYPAVVASYNLWAPRLHSHYEEHLKALYSKLPHL